jgi:hypothetical protein
MRPMICTLAGITFLIIAITFPGHDPRFGLTFVISQIWMATGFIVGAIEGRAK